MRGPIERIDLDTTTSTNDHARRWAIENPGRRAVITARTQTEGKGRRGRGWISPAGGAWMTVAVPVGMNIDGGVSLAAAATACGVIDEALIRAGVPGADRSLKIRWPNDLLLGDCKVGGVLGESITDDQQRTLLLGVGINVNNKVEGESLRTPAVSLAEHAGGPVDLPSILDALAERMPCAVDAFVRDGLSIVLREQIDARLAGRGERVRLDGGGESVDGLLVGIGAEGALVLKIDGRHRAFVSGELSCRVAD